MTDFIAANTRHIALWKLTQRLFLCMGDKTPSAVAEAMMGDEPFPQDRFMVQFEEQFFVMDRAEIKGVEGRKAESPKVKLARRKVTDRGCAYGSAVRFIAVRAKVRRVGVQAYTNDELDKLIEAASRLIDAASPRSEEWPDGWRQAYVSAANGQREVA